MLPSRMIEQSVCEQPADNTNPMYVYLNVSPYKNDYNKFGDVVGDCIIRSIATAEDRLYKTVAKDLLATLNRIGMRYYATFDEYYLENRAIKIDPHELKDGRKKLTVKQFAARHPGGRYVLSTRNYSHMTCLIDGICYDTFDCTDYKVCDAWQIPSKH